MTRYIPKKKNKSLLRRMLKRIKEVVALGEQQKGPRKNHLHWKQYLYREVTQCGSAFCAAGFTVELTGGVWVDPKLTEDHEPSFVYATPAEVKLFPHRIDYINVKDPKTKKEKRVAILPCHERAQHKLGLTNDEAVVLFSGDNTLEKIEHLVTEYCSPDYVSRKEERDRNRQWY